MSLIAVAVEVGVEIDPSRIVFGVMGVQAEKVAVEALAKPVAYFGLYQPMFPPGVAELPRIVVALYVERYAGAERRFDTQVDRRGGIVEQVALDGPFLGQG